MVANCANKASVRSYFEDLLNLDALESADRIFAPGVQFNESMGTMSGVAAIKQYVGVVRRLRVRTNLLHITRVACSCGATVRTTIASPPHLLRHGLVVNLGIASIKPDCLIARHAGSETTRHVPEPDPLKWHRGKTDPDHFKCFCTEILADSGDGMYGEH